LIEPRPKLEANIPIDEVPNCLIAAQSRVQESRVETLLCLAVANIDKALDMTKRFNFRLR